MSAEAAFYNNFDLWKQFFRQNKNDKDIEDFYFLCFILGKVYVSGWGKRQTGRTISFLVHLLKFESDTATSKDIAIIRLY